MELKKLIAVTVLGTVLAAAPIAGGVAQTTSDEGSTTDVENFNAQNLKEQIEQLRSFLTEADERLSSNRAELEEQLEAARRSPEIIDQMIVDLRRVIARFDREGDIRLQMVAAEEFARQKEQEYGGSTNSALQRIAPRFKEIGDVFLQHQLSAEDRVNLAMTQVRRLEENREAAVALLELGALQDAKMLLDDSLTQFDQVIDGTKTYADDLERATGQLDAGAF